MAIHHFRYSDWDGSQDVPDFSADDILESMAEDLLRSGDPERALRDLMRRGFRLPDGRRFDGMKRLFQQMRQYRENVFSRYDPNNMLDQVREQLQQIVEWEREEIDQRGAPPSGERGQSPDGQSSAAQSPDGQSPDSDVPDGQPSRERPPGATSPEGMSTESRPHGQQSSRPRSPASGQQQNGPGAPGQSGRGGESSQAGMQGQGGGSGALPSGQSSQSGGSGENSVGSAAGENAPDEAGQFREMLERMLQRKQEYLDQLPGDNAGRIKGLREYDFLSNEARDAFEELIGGMQQRMMEQYFQGLKQGIGAITPEQLAATREMVQAMNEMLEASARGDREAFNRFMEQYGDYFPPGIENLDQLLEHMQQQMSAMQSLLDNMDPEQRAELEAMMDELLQDDRLRLDLARLGANLAAMGYAPQSSQFPFRGQDAPGFGQSLDMMSRLQAMQDLENAMMSGDPFNAMSQAGGADPMDLFGPQLGGQIQAVKDMAQALLDAGYLQRQGERLQLTARAVRKIGDASLKEIFRRLKDDRAGNHATVRKGHGGDITQQSRPYQFGDPFHVDIQSTVMNGVVRDGSGTPVRIKPDDFEIFETERSVQHATVLALDMSHSMYANGLFVEAKRTALALDSLIRGQFPRDALYIIGFASTAFELKTEQLPTLAENDYVQGTNYDMALGLARRLLSRHRGGNRQILFVTDGEPTACMLPNGRVYFDWPPMPMVEDAALIEAARCAREGITINTFVLDPRPRLIAFAEEMTAVNHGRMFLCGPYHLGEQMVMDYINGRSVKRLH